MKLINPKGKEVEFNDVRANRILSNKVKRKQGWKSKDEVDAIEAEKNLKLHQDRIVIVGDLAEFIEGFADIDLSTFDEEGFTNLVENSKLLKAKIEEEKRLKAEQEQIKADAIKKEEVKKKRLANLNNQNNVQKPKINK